jgi:hypothetical protein
VWGPQGVSQDRPASYAQPGRTLSGWKAAAAHEALMAVSANFARTWQVRRVFEVSVMIVVVCTSECGCRWSSRQHHASHTWRTAGHSTAQGGSAHYVYTPRLTVSASILAVSFRSSFDLASTICFTSTGSAEDNSSRERLNRGKARLHESCGLCLPKCMKQLMATTAMRVTTTVRITRKHRALGLMT